jgi:hypothetical protein
MVNNKKSMFKDTVPQLGTTLYKYCSTDIKQ